MSVHAWAVSDVGRKRRANEDSFLVDADLGLFVVADGMGGHAAGDVASARCVEIVREQLVASRHLLESFARAPTPEGAETASQLMERAIQVACRDIHRLAEKDPSKRGMGTTCVALLVCGGKAVVGHVGDSRLYLRRNGKLHQLTEDHSLVQEQLKRGLISKDQAERSEVRNVITRAVGIQPSVSVDTLLTDVTSGDVFLLCSDGLHGYFEDQEELSAFLAREPRSLLAQELVDTANQRGGKDNITALVVSPDGDPASQEEPSEVEAKTELLRRIPLFQYLNYKELLAILAISRGRNFQAGDKVITDGEMGDELFVLFRGCCEVSKEGAVLATLHAGGHVGEMGLVDHAPRSADVIAVEPSHAISIDRDSLLKLMRKDSLLAVKLLWSFVQVLGERLRDTTQVLSGLRDEVERLRNEAELEPLPPPPPPFVDD
jgi:serine/threonine protein phosphatase PrpC